MRDEAIPLEGVYLFGSFRLDPVSRTLTHADETVKLAPRLFDTLYYLVQNNGRLVLREELMQAVWPARTVDGTSLGMAISSLRTVLKQCGAADTLIVTAPGRGYRFAARVKFEAIDIALQPAEPAGAPMEATVDAHIQDPPKRRLGVRWPALLSLPTLSLVGLAAWWLATEHLNRAEPQAFNPPPHSIAVLPFTSMTSDAKDVIFADGVAEELINALGRSGGLRVAARLSSFSFKNKPATITEIARALNVGLILEGSVRRIGTRVRIIAQLIDAATGYQVWAHSYERDETDLLTLQGNLAEDAASSLKIVLLPDEIARLTLGNTANPRAFDAYLAGLQNAFASDDENKRQAIADFSNAIQLDPSYALAYAHRAFSRGYLAASGSFANVAETRALLNDALADAEKSVALAPELGDAHAAIAYVLKNQLSDLGRASAEYSRALELAPGDAPILMRYAIFEVLLGHIQAALEAGERAVSLDPLTPNTHRLLISILVYAGRYDDAMAAMRQAETLQPSDPAADRIYLSIIQMSKGDAQGAAHTCSGKIDVRDLICLAWAQHELGNDTAAQSAFSELQGALGDNGAYAYARLLAGWGRREEALTWLQTAYRLHDPGLIEIRIDRLLAPLRAEPQFQEILHGLGFPD